ncbi:putative succinate-fumarate transporter [Cylindrobasidium torrendii FP15055 ss-10]|uniref:Putative succinate-fumarate transporter n=1 Tax=Cylindrobasidium torrendii FP15055 ss-10 TaxID=1314674 RepID=A0A0D7B4T0_9AGAR|nr:putative succinate-fumarate transporter [Cylindrobasidium torrendii FP15055 ss-10]
MSRSNRQVGFATHLTAGGIAGACEALACQPLDTIKVRMQLSQSHKTTGMKPRGFFATGSYIVSRETSAALYKGLGAVLPGLIPKISIRFASFEAYKSWLSDKATGKASMSSIFVAGLGAGMTEGVLVTTPTEVVKIRLQAQDHSLSDSFERPRYRSAGHAFVTIAKEEGFGALYRGVSLTALRQATNQGANMTVYSKLKGLVQDRRASGDHLPMYQTMAIGLVSGAAGPMCNAPIDTVKTRLQRSAAEPGVSPFARISNIAGDLWKADGIRGFYKGLTPRILRTSPGQAVVFSVYEGVRSFMELEHLSFVRTAKL